MITYVAEPTVGPAVATGSFGELVTMTGDSRPTSPEQAHASAGSGGTYRVEVDLDGGASLSTTLVMAAADARGIEPSKLQPPLYDIVDPDALDALFRSIRGNATSSPVRLTFAEWGCRMTVDSDGLVEVEPLDATS